MEDNLHFKNDLREIKLIYAALGFSTGAVSMLLLLTFIGWLLGIE